ncbi:MAG: PKD domain-containing protein [Gaiellaceae bacterium]
MRSRALLASTLALILLGGGASAAAAAAASTDPGLRVDVTPSTAAPGSVVTFTATATPGSGPDSASLEVRCNLSWSADRGSAAQLTPDASGLVFTIDATVPSDAVPGLRVGTCTVEDDQFRETTVPYTFTIAEGAANAPPTVSAGGPYTVSEGGSISLAASGSDPEGGTLSYAWDLDNDGTYETPGMTPTFSAAALDGPSSQTVGVQATDVGGLTATDTATIEVTNVAPTATFESPGATESGRDFSLALVSPQDASAADSAAGFTYAFDCGDGYGEFGTASTVQCAASEPGTLTVGGKIRDKDGGVTEYHGAVSVGVTYAGLCALVRAYSTDPKVAADLCAKLARAAVATTPTARAGILGAFRNQAAAKVGKGLTAEQVAELDLLSRLL